MAKHTKFVHPLVRAINDLENDSPAERSQVRSDITIAIIVIVMLTFVFIAGWVYMGQNARPIDNTVKTMKKEGL